MDAETQGGTPAMDTGTRRRHCGSRGYARKVMRKGRIRDILVKSGVKKQTRTTIWNFAKKVMRITFRNGGSTYIRMDNRPKVPV